nr:MAG TPA: hypothetical protein [Caudoviricetes sp.]
MQVSLLYLKWLRIATSGTLVQTVVLAIVRILLIWISL